MKHRITKVTQDKVDFSPATTGERPTTYLKREKFGVTDAAIGLVEGNQFQKGIPTYVITDFGTELSAQTGPQPAIDRNPYNFVALAANQPWTFELFAGHDEFKELSGVIEFEAEALTPCFIPEGFPFAPDETKADGTSKWKDDELRGISRNFCRLHDAEDVERYAIPGASLKGALRVAVEAATNSRFGVADRQRLEEPHMYRRRVFKAGIVVETPETESWKVQAVDFPLDGGGSLITPNLVGLLAARAIGKPDTKRAMPSNSFFTIPRRLVESYHDHIQNSHYDRHYKQEQGAERGDRFYLNLDAEFRQNLQLKKDDIVYFTVSANSTVITNFGKNVNYLWPARRSLRDLSPLFLPREPARLDKQTDMAEYLFGFISDHKSDGDEVISHPFRGQLKFETVWGPEVAGQATIPLALAPLTSPQSKGKSRPLYLAPDDQGRSSSFDDAKCEIRGRKFYWHQRPPEKQPIWRKHEFAGTRPVDREFRSLVASQCPPPLEALPAGVQFHGRIHFTCLHPAALGALLFVLQGDGSVPGERWALHLGKAKPRGLGSFRFRVKSVSAWRMADRYSKLTSSKGRVDLTPKSDVIIAAFRDWCAAKARMPRETPLSKHPHIQDFIHLHTWPNQPSFRYYPVNFDQYSWLPADNDATGEPRARTPGERSAGPQYRPPAMRRARDLQP